MLRLMRSRRGRSAVLYGQLVEHLDALHVTRKVETVPHRRSLLDDGVDTLHDPFLVGTPGIHLGIGVLADEELDRGCKRVECRRTTRKSPEWTMRPWCVIMLSKST